MLQQFEGENIADFSDGVNVVTNNTGFKRKTSVL
jgi:hypothetical protein